MAFIDERLLESVSYGTSYGVGYNTRVVALRSGAERRTPLWSVPKGLFTLIYKTLKPEDHEAVVSAFHVCAGRAHTFRFKDLTDFKVSAPVQFGVGTGQLETYRLVRPYRFGGQVYDKPVSLLVPGTIQLFEETELLEGATVDYAAGTVTLSAAPGARLFWSGEYDKRVRFDDDELQFTMETRAGGIVPILSTDVTLREVLA